MPPEAVGVRRPNYLVTQVNAHEPRGWIVEYALDSLSSTKAGVLPVGRAGSRRSPAVIAFQHEHVVDSQRTAADPAAGLAPGWWRPGRDTVDRDGLEIIARRDPEEVQIGRCQGGRVRTSLAPCLIAMSVSWPSQYAFATLPHS